MHSGTLFGDVIVMIIEIILEIYLNRIMYTLMIN